MSIPTPMTLVKSGTFLRRGVIMNPIRLIRWRRNIRGDLAAGSQYSVRMKIIPSESNFKKWTAIPPTVGDLIFLQERDLLLARRLGFPVYTTEEVRSQSLTLWTLNQRSWYLYALNRASYCVWLPVGVLESLDPELLKKISAIQRRLEVPTLLPSSKLSSVARARCSHLGRYQWVTSKAWRDSTLNQKRELLQIWFKHNKIENYASRDLDQLPQLARSELRRIRLDSVLNTYLDSSGPNCFAAVASAISSGGKEAAQQWLHWKPLARFLRDQHYRVVKADSPIATDVLIFRRKAAFVHAAYFIGGGYYFEMPGQDFYEPYRVEKFESWRRAWPDSQLSIYRKTRG